MKLSLKKTTVLILTIVLFSAVVFYYFQEKEPIELAQAQTPCLPDETFQDLEQM